MSQRNPMNERYTRDDVQGKSRSSAARAKPKAAASTSVIIENTAKSKKEIRREQDEIAAKARARAARKAGDINPSKPVSLKDIPQSDEYRKWRKIWWVTLIAAIAFTVLSWVLSTYMHEVAGFVALALAYVFLISAFILEFAKVRKLRNGSPYPAPVKDPNVSRNDRKRAIRAAEAKMKEEDARRMAQEEAEAAQAKANPKKKFGLFNKS